MKELLRNQDFGEKVDCDSDSAGERSGSISRPEAKILSIPLISTGKSSSLDSSVGIALVSCARGPGFKSRPGQLYIFFLFFIKKDIFDCFN